MPLITLTTDFGEGSYVAQVKGVILSLLPDARIVDATHSISVGDVLEGAYFLETIVPAFPEGSVHLVVVDPGVGTNRKALAVRYAGRLLVGPDNGVLSAFLSGTDEIHEITERALFLPEVSPTFHGRDVFAPVAAHLAAGGQLETVGPLLATVPVMLPELLTEGEEGVVLTVDRFGNLVTSFPAEALATRPAACLSGPEGRVAARARTYGEATEGEAFLYEGSGGRLEVAVPHGSATELLGWGRGTKLRLAEDEE